MIHTLSSAPIALKLDGLRAGYERADVLNGLHLEVEAGETFAILGPNGAGKTTLMYTVAGTIAARAGSIELFGTPVTQLRAEARIRRGLALVPERRQLFDHLSVADNLMLGAWSSRQTRDVGDRTAQVLDLFPKLKSRLKQRAGSLSGGEQQMLAIGRGLMAGPRILALDEPSLGLSPKVVEEIVGCLEGLTAGGLTVVLIEQNAAMAARLAGRIAILERGAISRQGGAQEIVSDSALAAAYFGSGKDASRALRSRS